MAIRLEVKIAGITELDRVFRKFQDNIIHWNPIFEDMAEAFYKQEESVFNYEGKYNDLNMWEPLTEKYNAWKQRKFPGRKVLELTGKLKESLTRKGAEGNIHEITADGMRIGTNLKTKNGYTLGTLHQLGTKKMVARPPLKLSAMLKKDFNQIMRKHLTFTNI